MINKLVEKIRKTGAPIVVGLDPMMKFVPEHIKKIAFEEKGENWRVLQKPSGFLIRKSLIRLMI